MDTTELTAEQCLAELRKVHEGRVFISSTAAFADYGDGFKDHLENVIILPGRRFQGKSLNDCMAQVRRWKESRS